MKQVIILSLFFVFCLCDQVQVNASVSLSGDGNSMFRSLFDYWSFAYNLIDPETLIEYTSVLPGQELNQIKSDPSQNDFASLCVGSTTDQSLQDSDFDYFPLFAASIVPVYNVPGIAYEDPEKKETPILSLSRETLADIFRGHIYMWDDDRIAFENPNVFLPNRTILVIIRTDPTSLTSIFLQALNSFVPDWQYGTNNTWPANYTRIVRNSAALSGEGTIPAITNFPFSIGYTTLGTVMEQGPVPYARIINRAGNAADATQIFTALDSITESESPIQFVDRPDGWPIISVQYQAILKDNCDHRRDLFKFYNWVKISDIAAERLVNAGGGSLGTFLESTTIDFLTSYKCGGQLVLEYKAIPQHSSKAFVGLLSLAMILLAISICLGFLWHYFNSSRCAKEVILYQVVQLLGIVITFLSVIFWYAIPTFHSVCSLRRWMTCIGFTLVFAAMFERTFRIHRVYGRVYKQNKLTGNIASILEVGGGVGIILVSQIIIMIVWSAVDPYESQFRPIDDISFQAEHICTLKYPNTWLALEVTYYGILMMWGIYVCYSTWELKNSILESRWILVSMYNNLLLLTLCATILPIVDLTDDLLFEIIVPLILLANTNVFVAVYIPTVLKKLKILASSSGDMSNDTKTSAVSATSPAELDIKTSGSK